jgi:hypothetical protein
VQTLFGKWRKTRLHLGHGRRLSIFQRRKSFVHAYGHECKRLRVWQTWVLERNFGHGVQPLGVAIANSLYSHILS